MADSLPLDTANLAGLFSSSILYGIFVVLFVICLYILLYRRNTFRPNYVLIVGAISMFVLNTAVIALSFSRITDAFIVYRDAPGGPIAILSNLGQWKEVARTALTLCYTVLADVILIYRCWVVWGRRLSIIAFPLVVLVAGVTMDILMVVTIASLSSGSTIFFSVLQGRITAALSIILAQNIILTGLIVYRIWTVNASTVGPAVGNLRPVISIIIESGVVFVATIFIFLMTYVANSNSQYILVDSINPMIGITFTLLTIRVSLSQKRSPTNTSQSHSHSQTRSQQIQLQPSRFRRPSRTQHGLAIALCQHYEAPEPYPMNIAHNSAIADSVLDIKPLPPVPIRIYGHDSDVV